MRYRAFAACRCLVCGFLLFTACSDDVSRSVAPASGPASGYYGIEVTDPELRAAEVLHAKVGGIAAYDIAANDEHTLQLTVQGHPVGGAVDIELGDTGVTLSRAFSYDPPRDPRFARFVAMGASLTQGVQNGVPTYHGGLMSPAAQIARQMGAYLPLPLLVRNFLPEMSATDIGPPPACVPPDVVAFVASAALEVLPLLASGYYHARVDADLAVQNLAVGGSRIHTVIYGPEENDFGGNFVGRLVLDPYEPGPIHTSQLEVAEQLEPTIVVITDLYYNDVAAAILGGDTIDVARVTPVDEYQVDLIELLDRLGAMEALVFVSNMPRPSVLPATREKRARMIETGASAADADAAIEAMDALAAEYNQILVEQVAGREGIFVVDAEARVDELEEDGLDVAGQKLSVGKFGGLLSFDGVHFTDTGYAMFANLFIDAINDALDTDIPSIELADVIAADAGSPAAIAAAGLDVSKCRW